MSTLGWVAVVLGFLLLNVVLAYVPIIFVVGYNLRERPKKEKSLLTRYVEDDELTTAEYVAATEREWEKRRHEPLK